MRARGGPRVQKRSGAGSLLSGFCSAFGGKGGRFGRKSGGRGGGWFPSEVVEVGGVRVSTVVFLLCVFEAILWTSCLLSSHSALAQDTVEAEHYLLRETQNLKENASRVLRSSKPVFEQSYLAKQHLQFERRFAQKILGDSNNERSDWQPIRVPFAPALSLTKGIPGPFSGVQAIH